MLFFLPSFGIAPATYSFLRNLGAGLTFCGVPVAYWDEGTHLADHLERFRPTVLMSLDRVWYGSHPEVGQVAVEAVRAYRRGRKLIFGLTYNQFPKDRAILSRQLDSAAALGVDFFVSYLAPPAVRARYGPFALRGFPVSSLEFGANPVLFHPLSGVERDLNFVPSRQPTSRSVSEWPHSWPSYSGITQCRRPGWPRGVVAQFPDQLRYLYARAKVGINLHVPFQIEDATELNERAYNLAASGVPQLMDNPALLPDRFGPKSVYSEPLRKVGVDQTWLQLALTAADLIAWTQTTLLTGDLAKAEPKLLRYRLLHVAARLVHGQRRTKIRIDARWPWAAQLADASPPPRPDLRTAGHLTGRVPDRPPPRNPSENRTSGRQPNLTKINSPVHTDR